MLGNCYFRSLTLEIMSLALGSKVWLSIINQRAGKPWPCGGLLINQWEGKSTLWRLFFSHLSGFHTQLSDLEKSLALFSRASGSFTGFKPPGCVHAFVPGKSSVTPSVTEGSSLRPTNWSSSFQATQSAQEHPGPMRASRSQEQVYHIITVTEAKAGCSCPSLRSLTAPTKRGQKLMASAPKMPPWV